MFASSLRYICLLHLSVPKKHLSSFNLCFSSKTYRIQSHSSELSYVHSQHWHVITEVSRYFPPNKKLFVVAHFLFILFKLFNFFCIRCCRLLLVVAFSSSDNIVASTHSMRQSTAYIRRRSYERLNNEYESERKLSGQTHSELHKKVVLLDVTFRWRPWLAFKAKH